jgi:predicted DNA-binding transcriptional regulator YafY
MAQRLVYERFLWFHDQVRRGAFPNARDLARQFEYSINQARRDIEFLRDRLGAPLEYDAHRKGYRYTDDAFELPATWLTEGQLTALLLARAALERLVSARALPELDGVRDKLATYGFLRPRGAPDPERLISLRDPAEAAGDPDVLHACLDALIAGRKLPIRYLAAASGEITERTVRPYHLVHHDGGWHLIAHCELRNAVRDFALVRTELTGPATEPFARDPAFDPDAYLEASFGIFHGPGRHQVVLRFTPFRARWVRHQRWHREQEMEEHADGSLTLRFPASHFPEVKMEILKFGADCEVLAPAALRQEIAAETARLTALYAHDATSQSPADAGSQPPSPPGRGPG